MIKSLLLISALSSILIGISSADVTLQAEYHLGETGSIGNNNLPLDSSGNNRNLTSAINGSGAAVRTNGVFAPGSTHYLDSAGTGDEGWYGNAFNGLANDNFAIGVYARAASNNASTQGDIVVTHNSGFAISLGSNGWGAIDRNTNSWISGNSGNAGTFTANTWVHLALIRSAGTTRFYVNGVDQGQTYSGAPIMGTAHMSVNPGGSTYFDGHMDEMRFVTFTNGETVTNIVNALQNTPNPAASKTITNGVLTATLDQYGALTLTEGNTLRFTSPFSAGTPSSFTEENLPAGNPFGAGKMLKDANSGDRIILLNDSPFIYVRVDPRSRPVVNPSKTVHALKPSFHFNTATQNIKASAPNGLFTPGTDNGQHLFTALADPVTNNGYVAGLVTVDAASPILFSKIENGLVTLAMDNQYGSAVPSTLSAFGGDWWVVGYFDDARQGLEKYGDEYKRINQLTIKHLPVGLMSWYCEKYGGALNQEAVVELSEFIADKFGDYGYGFVQIDDGWQGPGTSAGPAKNFERVEPGPNGLYKDGMVGPANEITALGLTPGLWLLPFGSNTADPSLNHLHPFLVKQPNGSYFTTQWSGTPIDASHPDGYAYVKEMMRRTVDDWGIGYLKLDGIHMAMATPNIYPYRDYRSDSYGNVVFHNTDMSNMQVGKLGLTAIREGAGNTFILGCATTQNERSLAMCLGKVDAMRVGPDSAKVWSGNNGSSIVEATRAAASLYFQNGRMFWVDPDSIYARDTAAFPLNEVRCFASFVTISGMLNTMTDWAPNYPQERIDLLRRTMPSHQLTSVRPIDYFRNDPARIWHLTYDVSGTKRHSLGIFNWTESAITVDIPASDLGLDNTKLHHTYEFWSKTQGSFTGSIQRTIPARSCLVLAINPETSKPTVLSTNRHITQGAVDLMESSWGNDALTGKSKVVKNDPYEIRIAKNGETLSAVNLSNQDVAAGVTAEIHNEPTMTRVIINSPTNREIQWSVDDNSKSFGAWQVINFGSVTAEGAGASDDPDKDGQSNLHEYAFGGDPNDPNKAAPSPTFDGAKLTFKRRVAAKLNFIVEESATMAPNSWTPVANTVVNVLSTTGNYEKVEVTKTSGEWVSGSNNFFRVRSVTLP